MKFVVIVLLLMSGYPTLSASADDKIPPECRRVLDKVLADRKMGSNRKPAGCVDTHQEENKEFASERFRLGDSSVLIKRRIESSKIHAPYEIWSESNDPLHSRAYGGLYARVQMDSKCNIYKITVDHADGNFSSRGIEVTGTQCTEMLPAQREMDQLEEEMRKLANADPSKQSAAERNWVVARDKYYKLYSSERLDLCLKMREYQTARNTVVAPIGSASKEVGNPKTSGSLAPSAN